VTTATLSAVEPVRIGPSWRRGPDGKFLLPALTLGWHVLWWTAEKLQHANGRPWRYTPEQARLTLWWYALDDYRSYAYRDGVIQRLKGWGKDPVGATWCAVEFVGPSRPTGEVAEPGNPWGIPAGQPLGAAHPEAWVQTAAVSKDQTRNTMTLFPGMFTKATIAEYEIDLGKEIIYAHRGAQRIEAVTSSPRALEGARSTFVLRNETHHWLSTNDGHEMDAVIARNADKSPDGSARALSITNAYMPGEDSVAERARDAWEDVQAGRAVDVGMMYDSLEAPPDAPLTAEAAPAVVEGVRGDSVWLSTDRIVKSILDRRNPPSRSRRFWYNQITADEDSWVTMQQWDACGPEGKPELADRVIASREMVALFFDGSKSDDATALVASCMSDGHVFLVGRWQRPSEIPSGDPWFVPRSEVDSVVRRTFRDFDPVAMFADPGGGEDDEGERYWDALIDEWGRDFGDRFVVKAVASGEGRHPVMWDMRSPTRQHQFTLAVERTYTDIDERALTHDGNRALRRDVLNAKRALNKWGVSIRKEHRESGKKIDAAVCMVGARMARRLALASPDWAKRVQSENYFYVPRRIR
jgi:hypothetical protein